MTNDYSRHVADRVARLAGDARLDGVDFLIEQRVLEGADLVACYHVRLAGGAVHVAEGAADDPDVTITQDRATADAMRSGEIHAHRAFLTGRLRIDGDIDRLLDNSELLRALVADLSRPDA